jgi:hypothetical protein
MSAESGAPQPTQPCPSSIEIICMSGPLPKNAGKKPRATFFFRLLIRGGNKKAEEKNLFPVIFSLQFVFSRFFAVSLHEDIKNTMNVFPK